MGATSIQVSERTRQRLEYLKVGGQTYDEVIEELLALHPQRLTWADIVRRAREPGHSFQETLEKSRRLTH